MIRFLRVFLVALIPLSLILGTNFSFLQLGGRGINGGLIDIIIVILFIFSFLSRREFTFPRGVFIIVTLLTLVIYTSVFLQFVFSQALPGLGVFIELIRWLEYLLIFILGIIHIRNESQIKGLLTLTFLGSLVFLFVSIQQAMTFNFFETRVYGLFASAADRSGDSVANPNVAGTFLMWCSIFFFNFIGTFTKRWQRLVLTTISVLSVIVMMMTLSRSSFLALILAILLTLILRKVSLWKISLGFFAFIFLIFTVIESSEILSYRLYSSFESGTVDNQSVLDRTERSVVAITQGLDNFWFGTGFADFERHYGFLTPDNFYAEMFSEIGFIGLSLFVCLFVAIFREAFEFLKIAQSNLAKAFAIAFISAFAGFLLANYTGNLFRNPRLLGLMWLYCAILFRWKCIIAVGARQTLKNVMLKA